MCIDVLRHERYRWSPARVPMTRLLEEIRELGYTGSANLLVRYLNQGRAQDERAAPPRRLVGWIRSRPAELADHDRTHLDELLAACPPLAVLAEHVRTFRRPAHHPSWHRPRGLGERGRVQRPARPHAFVRGLRKDLEAVSVA